MDNGRATIEKFAQLAGFAARILFGRQTPAGSTTKRIRLTRAILIGGSHAEEGSIHDLAQSHVDDLIAQGSAVRLTFFSRFLQGFRFFRDSRTSRARLPRVHATEVSKERKPMNRTEIPNEQIERAERCGSRLAYDSGFLTMTLAASADESEIEPLGPCLKDIFSFAIARARGARGKDFVGQQVFVPGLQVVGTFVDVTASGI